MPAYNNGWAADPGLFFSGALKIGPDGRVHRRLRHQLRRADNRPGHIHYPGALAADDKTRCSAVQMFGTGYAGFVPVVIQVDGFGNVKFDMTVGFTLFDGLESYAEPLRRSPCARSQSPFSVDA